MFALQVQAAELQLYGNAARLTQLMYKSETDRTHPLPQEAFVGDTALTPQEAVPAGGALAQQVLESIEQTNSPTNNTVVGKGLLSIVSRMQGTGLHLWRVTCVKLLMSTLPCVSSDTDKMFSAGIAERGMKPPQQSEAHLLANMRAPGPNGMTFSKQHPLKDLGEMSTCSWWYA